MQSRHKYSDINRSSGIWRLELKSVASENPSLSPSGGFRKLLQTKHFGGNTVLADDLVKLFYCCRHNLSHLRNPLLQNHPVLSHFMSFVVIWHFKLRILDLWNRYAISTSNRQTSLLRHPSIVILYFFVETPRTSQPLQPPRR